MTQKLSQGLVPSIHRSQEQERHSDQKFLKPGYHKLAVDMCELGGGEVLKMRYEGPDTDNKKITIPKKALKYEEKKAGPHSFRLWFGVLWALETLGSLQFPVGVLWVW